MNVLGTPRDDQCQAYNERNQTRPEKGADIAGVVENHQCQHGDSHGDSQGDQENADNETDNTKGRQRHAVVLTWEWKGAILPAVEAL